MPSFEYPFTLLGIHGVYNEKVYRPLVPIIVGSTKTARWQRFIALADSGADANLIPGGVTKILGCAIKAGKPGGGATGIGGNMVPTWYHELQVKLLSPDKLKEVWVGKPLEVECIEANSQVLLGTIGFLENFKATFDYPNKKLILEL